MRKKTLYNIKGAGRPAIHDRGIRHIARDKVTKHTSLHLTIKIERLKAGLRNKDVLKQLHDSIKKARKIGLRVIHYTLEFDHVHLLVEVDSNQQLAKGMQSFGISFSKGINKIKAQVGKVFKTRYHFRKLKSPNEIKNVIFYILGNSLKHKKDFSILSPYNTAITASALFPGFELGIEETITKSVLLSQLRDDLKSILSKPKSGGWPTTYFIGSC